MTSRTRFWLKVLVWSSTAFGWLILWLLPSTRDGPQYWRRLDVYERYGVLEWLVIRSTWYHGPPRVIIGSPEYSIQASALVWTIVWTLLFAGLAVLIIKKMSTSIDYITCHACGYNLTGNTTGQCPECGEEVLVEKESADRSPLPPGEG